MFPAHIFQTRVTGHPVHLTYGKCYQLTLLFWLPLNGLGSMEAMSTSMHMVSRRLYLRARLAHHLSKPDVENVTDYTRGAIDLAEYRRRGHAAARRAAGVVGAGR